jgi:undecaprenyl diphosphate synthase
MSLNLLYGLYERRLLKQLEKGSIPEHVAVILDGNRRWAKAVGSPAAEGHRAGAGKIAEFLEWSDEIGVELITLWMLSTDNLSRGSDELEQLQEIIASAVEDLGATGRWCIRLVGDLNLLNDEVEGRLRAVEASTAEVEGMVVNVAVGYGGRHELVDAVRELLLQADADGKSIKDLASSLTDADIAEHLYTKGQPDPDLVIRTSGEQRLSGFMVWQSAHSEFYFCDAYWPDFRRVDFLRALRSYGQRERRMGR